MVQQQQHDDTQSPAAPSLSRVYFSDLVYLRFGGDAAGAGAGAGAGVGMWVHQPKRSGELWPSARSGHAAAVGEQPRQHCSRRHWHQVSPSVPCSWEADVHVWRLV